MTRAILCATLLLPAVLAGQSRPPAFLDEEAAGPRLETRHLVAEADGPIRVARDGTATLTLVVTPRPGMHVYAADATGYVGLSMATEAAGVTAGKVTYPAAETYVFPPTGETSRVYMQPFRVTQRITASRTAAATGTVTLRYQACDDRVCYRPTTGRLAVDITR